MSTSIEPSGTYTIDPTHSRIGFVTRHAMVTKVRGSFNEFEGSGTFDAANPSNSSLALTVNVASIDTRNADRDGHLLSGDFFDVATYPQISFTSSSVTKVNDEEYRVAGDLSIRGITNPIEIDFEFGGVAVDAFGNQRLGLDGKAVVNRKDWGISWNAVLDTGGVMLSEKITLEFEVSAIKAQ